MPVNVIGNLARWLAYSIKLQDRFTTTPIPPTKVKRGDIYACFLGQNIGHEKSRLEPRPCVVVSIDQINGRSGNIVVVPLSKNIKWADKAKKRLQYDWHYVLYKSKYKLMYDSAAQCEDIRCISKIRLGKYIDHVDPSDMKNLTKRMKRALQM